MRHRLQGKNASVEIIDHPQDDNVILNIHLNTTTDGTYEQLVMPRYIAKALGRILIGDET